MDGYHPNAAGSASPAVLVKAAESFTEHRSLLFSIAYNVLGTVCDTEDVLQDTWLQWAKTRSETIADPRAYLVRVAVRQALARLRRARKTREVYVGPWLPEPVVTEDDHVVNSIVHVEAISLALMVILETLTPLERVVFVLHEAFGFDHNETATILERSPAAVRQLAHRAREHVRARRQRFPVDPETHRAATKNFTAAALGGNLPALLEVLAPDVTLWSDGGGHLPAARRVIEGRAKIARLIAARAGYPPAGLVLRDLDLNGSPAIVAFTGPRPYGVLAVDVDPKTHLISAIYAILNPDKIAHLSAWANPVVSV